MNLQDFQKTVYPLKDKLFRFSKRLLERTEEAEDIVQEVFIRLWNRREKLDEYRSVEALAMITAKNLCLDKLRTRRFALESLDDKKSYIDRIPGETRADHSDLIHGIHQAIRQLPELQQMVIHLRDIEEYEFDQIAEMLEMNENAVRVNLSRARKRVREILTNAKVYEYQRN
ncbi:MAG: sigma-70 family RNA polymerase sigma factor [bacterium]